MHAGTPSLPASAPVHDTFRDPLHRACSDISLDPTVAFLSGFDFSSPISTPTQPSRRRSVSSAHSEALYALEGHSGSFADKDGVPAAVGNISGLRDAAPEGKRRIRRCLGFALPAAAGSGGSGSPQEYVPKELLEYSDVGLDEDGGGDRKIDESPEPDWDEVLLAFMPSVVCMCSLCPAVADSGEGDAVEVDAVLLLGRRYCMSEEVLSERRSEPGDGGIRGIIDLGREIRLCGSSLLGDVAAEHRSSLVGDRTSRLVRRSILRSRSVLTNSKPSAFLTRVFKFPISHSRSLTLLSFASTSSSKACKRSIKDISTSASWSLSSLTLSSNFCSQSSTCWRRERASEFRVRSLAARVLWEVGDMSESSFVFTARS